jgi:HSP20 family protein
MRLRLAWSKLYFQSSFQKEKQPMNIVRYQRYPQSDLSVALDRLANMREEMDRMFESPFGSFFRPLASLSRWTPAVDVYQDKDQFTVHAELPGLKKEEIEISLHGDTLTIAGERKLHGSADQAFRTERFFGKFQRSLTLPAAVSAEHVKATYKDGILTVVLPKAEEAKPKQIEVAMS